MDFPDELTVQRLIDSVLFTIGSEYIVKNWIKLAFEKLRLVFAREIRDYDGTIAVYLADKSQKLRVSERIIFHPVENYEEDYPFAFLPHIPRRMKAEKRGIWP